MPISLNNSSPMLLGQDVEFLTMKHSVPAKKSSRRMLEPGRGKNRIFLIDHYLLGKGLLSRLITVKGIQKENSLD